jgi:hypothetical protein
MKPADFSITLTALLFCSSLHAGECEVSLPHGNDLPDSLLSVPEGFAWVGSPKLAATVPINGHWKGMGPERNYFDKWWWWRDGYRATEEADPELVVTATRLDESSPPVVIRNATNAFGPANEFGPGWDAMLVGMEFPTSGCWEVVGRYRDQELRFVFEVGGTSELADEPRVWEDAGGIVELVDLSLADREALIAAPKSALNQAPSKELSEAIRIGSIDGIKIQLVRDKVDGKVVDEPAPTYQGWIYYTPTTLADGTPRTPAVLCVSQSEEVNWFHCQDMSNDVTQRLARKSGRESER